MSFMRLIIASEHKHTDSTLPPRCVHISNDTKYGRIPLRQKTASADPLRQNPASTRPLRQNRFGGEPLRQNHFGRTTSAETASAEPLWQNRFGRNRFGRTALAEPLRQKALAEGQCVKNLGKELAPSSLVSPFKFSQPLQV